MAEYSAMNGPQMKLWRQAEGLSLREVCAEYLHGEVSQSTLSRWEDSHDSIPQWATDALLSKTRIELPLDQLHTLLDYARDHHLNFRDLISQAIAVFIATRTAPPPPSNISINEIPPPGPYSKG